jgi:predicted metalloprotease with PDZ domain
MGLAFFTDHGIAAGADYVVAVVAERPRVAAVTARLRPAAPGLCMTRAAADTGLTHGWATFVHDLEVRSLAGAALDARYDGAGCWHIPTHDAVTVTYEVLLQHDRFPNEPGDDELAYAGEWGQFWTGRALFLEGARPQTVRVRFELPDGWQVTAPWTATAKPDEFRPVDVDALLDNGFMLGRHATRTLARPGAHVQIGLAGAGPTARAGEVAAILESALDAFTALHRRPPPGGELAVFVGQGRLVGGGVIGNTISMLVADEVPDELMPTLAYIVTHEVFHLWNAHLEYADEASFYWFSEGFAEYYTFRELRAAGIWNEGTQRSQLDERVRLYRAAAGDLSLARAGQQKLDHYDLVYSGGLLAAAALDAGIRKQSAGRHQLDDALPVILAKHQRGGEVLSIDALVARIREATGVDTADFFRRHITGAEPVPVVRSLPP